MNLYERLSKKPATFRQFTGLTVAEFDQLRDDLEPVLAARQAQPNAAGPDAGSRGPGGSRNSVPATASCWS
jgi:hypothetical protein